MLSYTTGLGFLLLGKGNEKHLVRYNCIVLVIFSYHICKRTQVVLWVSQLTEFDFLHICIPFPSLTPTAIVLSPSVNPLTSVRQEITHTLANLDPCICRLGSWLLPSHITYHIWVLPALFSMGFSCWVSLHFPAADFFKMHLIVSKASASLSIFS